MKNGLDEQYIDLLKDILENGVEKDTRNGKTLSVFGRSIRYKFKDGKFPLLTTKRIPFKLVVTELLWFLRGDTNIKYLVDNDCHIWNGDAYKAYEKKALDVIGENENDKLLSKEEFINRIKTDDEFAKKWGDLGPVYGAGWRNWKRNATRDEKIVDPGVYTIQIDQISELIKQLKDNPDSRRLLVSAWNPADLPKMVLPPCHYGFQVYTRELSLDERLFFANKNNEEYEKALSNKEQYESIGLNFELVLTSKMNELNIPSRAISLMWNQRSVDTFLGLPFNIASYGLLLEIIAKAVNMVPDELIGNLGDTHLYSNHIEQAKEQIGRGLTIEERIDLASNKYENFDIMDFGIPFTCTHDDIDEYYPVPKRTREPYPLPTLNINTEFWPYEGGECGIGPLDAIKVFESFIDDNFCRCLLEEDIQLSNYQSHLTIKAPLSN